MGGRAGDAGSCAQVSGDTAEVQGSQHDRQAEREVGDHDPPEVRAGVSKSWGRGLRSMTRGDTLHGE
jgi:hypothetical protein